MQHELPTHPWKIYGTDLFMIGRDTYLLICDYYSKFPFVYHIKGKVTSDAIVSKMNEVFAENGTPDRVVSDNGSHYTSQTFRNFATEWDFDHVTSSPHFPQSNGFIEWKVQTVKNALKKAAMTRSNSQKALLALRSTPIDSHLISPAEMLNARKYLKVEPASDHCRETRNPAFPPRQTSYTTTRPTCSRTRYTCARLSDKQMAACQSDNN